MVHKELFGRRYLVVADDVWSEEAWDIINRILPQDTRGSLVLMTTRLQNVAAYAGSSSGQLPHEIRFLSEEQSWTLLNKRALENRSCPLQLEQIGKKIAKCCHGLPLMIVVVAGLLKENITEQHWSNALHIIGSSARADLVEQCTKVLSISYDNLPIYLKPCFLYVATEFPEDYEVRVDRLVRLWMAKGFVRSRESGSAECLETVAEGYLNDLVGRSLLIGSRKRYNGKITAVKIHDSLRDIGKLKAKQERFHYHQRRQVTCDDSNSHSKFRKIKTHLILTRSSRYSTATVSFENHSFLSVLDTLESKVNVNPHKLVLLKYLAFQCSDPSHLDTVSMLQNLETLVVQFPEGNYRRSDGIALRLWQMPFLKHAIILGYFKWDVYYPNCSVKETNLQTLSTADSFVITQKMIDMFVNLRILSLNCRKKVHTHMFEFSDLVYFQNLVELTLVCAYTHQWVTVTEIGLALPQRLRKLKVIDLPLGLKDMDNIGSLSNLEVLILKDVDRVCWNPLEGQFPGLKLLELECTGSILDNSGLENIHFPSLETLVLKEMELEEIPTEIGEINALKLIELHGCQQSLVASAKKIQAEQHEIGNQNFQVRVFVD